MRITYKTKNTIDAKDTNTVGKHSYLVATQCGGLMEDPEIWYTDYQIIHADTAKDAKKKYDEINNCSYFYGKVLRLLPRRNKYENR